MRIEGGAEERERGGQSASADAGNQLEHGARAGLGPAAKQAGAKRAVLAAARYRQDLHLRRRLVWRQAEHTLPTLHRGEDLGIQRAGPVGGEETFMEQASTVAFVVCPGGTAVPRRSAAHPC